MTRVFRGVRLPAPALKFTFAPAVIRGTPSGRPTLLSASAFDRSRPTGTSSTEPQRPIELARLVLGMDARLLADPGASPTAATLSARFVQDAYASAGTLTPTAAEAVLGSGAELHALLSAEPHLSPLDSLEGATPGDVVFFGDVENPHQLALLYAGQGDDGSPRFIGVSPDGDDLRVVEQGAPEGLTVQAVLHDDEAPVDELEAAELVDDGDAAVEDGNAPLESGAPAVEAGPSGGGGSQGAPAGGGVGSDPGVGSVGPELPSLSDLLLDLLLETMAARDEAYLDELAKDPEYQAWCKANGKEPSSKDSKKAFAKAKLARLDKSMGGRFDLTALGEKLEADPEGAQSELEALAKALLTERVDLTSGGVTLGQLLAIMPGLLAEKAAQYLPVLNAAMQRFNITTPLRQAAFLAQVAHESVQLRYFEEIGGRNTRYAPYYGRGPIQLTWESNYRAASRALFGDDRLVRSPDLAARPEVAFLTAGWFWASRNLNAFADQRNFGEVTRRVNGRNHGKADDEYRRALSVLRA